MPNWTGDDGVSDYKGPGADPEPVPMLKLEHSGMIMYVEQHPAGYVISHEDLSTLLTLAGQQLQAQTKTARPKKRPIKRPTKKRGKRHG